MLIKIFQETFKRQSLKIYDVIWVRNINHQCSLCHVSGASLFI